MRGAAAMRASGVLLLAALLGAASALDAPRSALKAATNTLVTSAQATAASDDTAQLLVSPEGEADRVTSLPGQPAPDVIDGAMPHNLLFTGYVTVDEAAGRALFYAFQTSGAGAKHPLVLWLKCVCVCAISRVCMPARACLRCVRVRAACVSACVLCARAACAAGGALICAPCVRARAWLCRAWRADTSRKQPHFFGFCHAAAAPAAARSAAASCPSLARTSPTPTAR
jgi:hypothetical protein